MSSAVNVETNSVNDTSPTEALAVNQVGDTGSASFGVEEVLAAANQLCESANWPAALALCQELHARYPSDPRAEQMGKQIELQIHSSAAAEHFPGPIYLDWLKWFHATMLPANYVEIGVESGASLQFAKHPTRAVGIDPAIQIVHPQETWSKLFKLPSDDFFYKHDLRQVLGADTVDLAFIDGLHFFDQALRDFINIERYANARTVVLFHDIYPVTAITAERDRKTVFWPGDTWKVMMILKELRPDLNIFTIPAYPSGLGVVTGLNPESQVLSEGLREAVQDWMPVKVEPYMAEMNRHLNVVSNDFVTVSKRLRTSAA